MTLHINCFTVASFYALREGVPLSEGIELINGFQGKLSVRLSENHDIRLGLGSTTYPYLLGRKVVSAQVAFYKKHARLVLNEHPGDRLIVRVIARDLDFNYKPLAPNLNIWAGGDGNIQAFAQYGAYRDIAQKDQLFEIPEGKSIVLVDTKGCVVMLSCTGGQPIIAEVGVEVFVNLLVERATAQRTRTAVHWAWGNIVHVEEHAQTYHPKLFADARAALNRLV